MFSNYAEVARVAFKIATKNLAPLTALTALPLKNLKTYKVQGDSAVIGTVVIEEGWREGDNLQDIHAVCFVFLESSCTPQVVQIPSDYFRFYEELGLQLLLNLG